ncbi:Putative amino-acid metabolite efflux pump [Desulfonema limicola]|uniref:Amino-acid metabolite efflux pump n=1 Tax=Desulfonema limicola TaxID=45656 RepID=A0A975B5J7_9BACT|nr:DMT family transporter [Desulfonema limicola]QTA79173.1 Putative amino-acid metabolite efflux pump [Desulfonema limicola]
MKSKKIGMIQIHIAVFLFGLSGLFGKLLTIPASAIVFGRTFFAFLALSVFLILSKNSIKTKSGKDLIILILLGILLAVHWISFFHAIQISTVAVGLLTFSTFPLFVTFMEPVFFKEKLRLFDILTAVSVFFGLFLVVPDLNFNNNITRGALWGIFSGFTFAILSLLNRKYAASYSATVIAFYQNLIAALFLLPFFLSENLIITQRDYVLLAFLGIFCTALAHGLFINSLVHIKTQLAGIITGLEPLYGIIFAFLFLNEIPGLRTISGGIIILGSILLATIKTYRK